MATERIRLDDKGNNILQLFNDNMNAFFENPGVPVFRNPSPGPDELSNYTKWKYNST